MVKKLFIVLSLLVVIIGFEDVFEIAAQEKNVNSNGVEIYENDYEIFNALMYEEKDIDYLTQEKVDKLRCINISHSFSDIQYIKIPFDSNIEGQNREYQILTKEQFENEVTIQSNNTSNNLGISRSVITEEAYYRFGYLTLRISGIFDSSASANGRFTVRVTVTWVSDPEYRMPDIVSILFDENLVKLRQVLVQDSLGSRYMYDFYTVSWHDLKKYENNIVVSDEEIIEGTDYGENLDYTYDEDAGLAVVYELPVARAPIYDEEGDSDGYGYQATNLRFILEANFDVLYPNLGVMDFKGQYVYNTPEGELGFDISNISFINVGGKKILNIFNIITIEQYYEVYEVSLYFSDLSDDEEDNVGSC